MGTNNKKKQETIQLPQHAETTHPPLPPPPPQCRDHLQLQLHPPWPNRPATFPRRHGNIRHHPTRPLPTIPHPLATAKSRRPSYLSTRLLSVCILPPLHSQPPSTNASRPPP